MEHTWKISPGITILATLIGAGAAGPGEGEVVDRPTRDCRDPPSPREVPFRRRIKK
jgi:hypothetical protein